VPIGWPLPEGPWRRAATGDRLLQACQLQFDTRRFANGRLQAIDLSRALVRWQADGQGDIAELPFAAFRCLRMMALLPAEPKGSPGWRPPPMALPYRVEFAEGAAWSGLTFRVSGDGQGFFLCEPVDEINNLRLAFLPRRAYRSLHIGAARLPEASGAVGAAAGHVGPPRARGGRTVAPRLGQLLVELGLIDPQQLQCALAAQRANRGLPLGELLVQQGALTPEDLARALAVKTGQSVDASR
jgi:hypothetical protein